MAMISAEERERRRLRALRFAQPPPCELARLAAPKAAPIAAAAGSRKRARSGSFLVGTSCELEKPYLRLTSEPDPATVRPVAVLEQSLELVKRRWKADRDIPYCTEQLKSIRQDLTLQHCAEKATDLPFVIRVYELHARLALESGDLHEFNQCLTKLLDLHPAARKVLRGAARKASLQFRHEFLAYHILYALIHGNTLALNSALASLKNGKRQPQLQFAMAVVRAVRCGDFRTFFRLYAHSASLKNMSAHLLDHLLPDMRVTAYKHLCAMYAPQLAVRTVQQALGFKNSRKEPDGDLMQFLKKVNAKFEPRKAGKVPRSIKTR